MRRMCVTNLRNLYPNQCKLCGKKLLASYSPDKPIVVYCNSCWFSDKWDGISYGKDYDFSKPFFQQMKELIQTVPWPAVSVDSQTIENSEYTNAAGSLKNCYLTFHVTYAENSSYCDYLLKVKDSFDLLKVDESELCYQCVNIKKCYNAKFCVDCEDCNDITLSMDLMGCENCFGCVGLRKKKFCIFNVEYSEKEYRERIKQFDLRSHAELQAITKQVHSLWLSTPRKFIHDRINEDVTGDYIDHSKNVQFGFQISEVEDSKYCGVLYLGVKDCYDYNSWGDNASLVYECQNVGQQINNVQFSYASWENIMDLQYCVDHCNASSNLFGCVGLRKKQYCILNKQYTKSEYEALMPKIIEHMNTMPYVDAKGRVYKYGEFFPFDMSPFGYNETMAHEYFPLTQSQGNEMGVLWHTPASKDYKITLPATGLPDSVSDATDSITKEIIGCEHAGSCSHQCTTAFKILPQDLAFYKKLGVALPRLCPNCRFYERKQWRNPMKLWSRECGCAGEKSTSGGHTNVIKHFHGASKCSNKFETSYAPTRPEILYCEQCYQSEII